MLRQWILGVPWTTDIFFCFIDVTVFIVFLSVGLLIVHRSTSIRNSASVRLEEQKCQRAGVQLHVEEKQRQSVGLRFLVEEKKRQPVGDQLLTPLPFPAGSKQRPSACDQTKQDEREETFIPNTSCIPSVILGDPHQSQPFSHTTSSSCIKSDVNAAAWSVTDWGMTSMGPTKMTLPLMKVVFKNRLNDEHDLSLSVEAQASLHDFVQANREG
eukprot:gb/GEZN01014866.1/.p1 GENE.gb/GEZN01014866.1/~~gb/GEZN01014866.1/.p1  ORF type:complete len:224 (-),score=19.21 gb/GEZN01014866.1/:256-894(-)